MEQNRGRSLSVGRQQKHGIRHSPSPQPYINNISDPGLDPSVTNSTFTPGDFNPHVPPTTGAEPQYDLSTHYLGTSSLPAQYEQHILPSNAFQSQELGQSYGNDDLMSNVQHRPSHLNLRQSSHQFSSTLIGADAPAHFNDFPQSQDLAQEHGKATDNTFLLDPQLPGDGQTQNQSINPADIQIMSNMSSPQNFMPTPSNLVHTASRSSPRQQSPVSNHAQFYSPNHSRNTSLDPSSAAFAHGQQPADWTGMLGGTQFQTHRRAPSEHSDVSSVAPSPFISQQDNFDTYDQSRSPMMNAQQDNNVYNEALGMEQFSLSDARPQQQPKISPRHSPYVSPRMAPQPGLGISRDDSFMLAHDMHNNFNGAAGSDLYTSRSDQGFSNFDLSHESVDMGQAAQMVPPEINVEFAPSRQQNFESIETENDADALSPPERGRRGRIRAKSDPFGTSISRPLTPTDTSPNLTSIDPNQRNRSLSPFDVSFPTNNSRDTSPASKSSRRSSTSSINPNRDYILELADPNRPSASGTDSKRVQKHPATFQCTLCPKRFTRAYNLRSHLRTHTDERPFVCTVCGKAFARQHDRKRHEGLHSGEKKFVCRGELGAGGNWGCGRRFARADALGRHFRSEAGRVCIKPLLDEEAMERQRVYDEQMMNQSMQVPNAGMQHPSLPSQRMDINGGGGDTGVFTLPAALLAQYPALQGLQWDQLPADDGGELSGRSSFDASSGGDYYEDDGEAGGYVSGPGTGFSTGNQWGEGHHEWASDYEGR